MSRKVSREIIEDAVKAIQKKIEADPLSRASIADLTDEFEIGRNQLQKVFRSMTGKTIMRYRLEHRMIEAGKIFDTKKLPVKEVSIICGYKKNKSNFSSDFKKVLKMSPEQWLKRSSDK